MLSKLKNITLSFRQVNKIVLLLTLASLATNLEKGSFSRHFIPSLFQLLLLASIILTIIYLMMEHKIKEFFDAVPKKIWIAIISFYALVGIGWVIAIFSLGIPTTLTTILDLGTFTMGIVLFFLVSFYAKGSQRYARWSLYAILIPNVHLLYYYLTHGLVGYWGVVNDFSLDKVLDPNILSKTLLVPALFFTCLTLFALKNKKWWRILLYAVLASLAVMMIFWTVSRGGALSLLLGVFVTWIVFSVCAFSWKNFLGGAAIILVIISAGFLVTPNYTRQAMSLKTKNTFTLPAASNGKIGDVTAEEIQKLPQTESRLLIWHFYPRYILKHPFGVGPNSSHDFNFHDIQGVHIYFGPDSTYLIVALWGGLLGLIVYLYIVWSAFTALWQKWRAYGDEMTLALMSILFTLSAALFFDGMLSLYWFYVILALSLQKYEQQ